MKSRPRRLGALAVFLLLLCSLAHSPGQASSASAYFTAVNDQLMPLNDETMPFYSNGVLYVSGRLFEGGELGVSYSRHPSLGLATLYMHGSTLDLRFDLAGQVAYDKEGNFYSGYAIERGGMVFFPLRLVCQYFNLSWSYCETDIIPLIRVKNDNVILSDTNFIYAAATLMNDRYSEYERSQSSRPPVTPGPGGTDAELPIQAAEGQKVYLLFDGSGALEILPALGDVQAPFLLSAEQMENGDLLRALAAGGHAAALRVLGETPEAAEEEILLAREAMWRAACVRLELVWYGGEAALAELWEEQGCLPVHFTLDASGEQASGLLRSIGRHREDVAVYLGDSGCVGMLPELLSGLKEGSYRLSAWRLTA